MGRLTMEMVARATMEVDALSHDGKVRLGDEVFAAQPNLLGSILVLARMGVNMPEVEIGLQVLFVAFLAMKRKRSINHALARGVGTDAQTDYAAPSSMLQGSSAS